MGTKEKPYEIKLSPLCVLRVLCVQVFQSITEEP